MKLQVPSKGGKFKAQLPRLLAEFIRCGFDGSARAHPFLAGLLGASGTLSADTITDLWKCFYAMPGDGGDLLFDLGEADWWGSVFLATNVLNGSRAYFTALEVRERAPTQPEILKYPILAKALLHLAQYSTLPGAVPERAARILEALYPLDPTALPEPANLQRLLVQPAQIAALSLGEALAAVEGVVRSYRIRRQGPSPATLPSPESVRLSLPTLPRTANVVDIHPEGLPRD